MSTVSYQAPCPVCQEEMDICSDNRPCDLVSGWCNNCGFSYVPEFYRMDLEEINDTRKDLDLPPITKKQYNSYNKEIKLYVR